MTMRFFRTLFLGGFLATALAPAAWAQSYPLKPIRFVAPIPAGGSTDTLARDIAKRLSDAWGQPVVVENLPGAAGSIGAAAVAKAAPDGYTILLVNVGHAINASVYPTLPFDSVKDFSPIILMASLSMGLVVHPSVPAQSLKEFIALAKSKPGGLNFGSSGNGGASHLAGEIFKSMTGTQLVHVPYKGSAPAVADLLAGHVQAMFSDMPLATPYIKAGKLRPLAIAAPRRSPIMPDLPTFQEAGLPGYDIGVWVGILAPAGVPKDIVAKLNAEIARILKLPDMRDRVQGIGFDLVASTPEQFAAILQADVAKFAKVVKEAGVKAN
jgi:tripartite-type tricarboxylate transporter receptor subunit TctC